MKEKPAKNALPDQKKVSDKGVVKNTDTRKAINDAIAGKGLSRIYTNSEEMFDDLDFPEITQQDLDHAVKRNGLKPISKTKGNVSQETAVKSAKGLKKT